MPTVSPTLESGIQTLQEAIQLTPASPALAIISTSRNILLADKSASQDEQRLARMVLDIAIAYSDGVKKSDDVSCNDAAIKRISNNLHRCLESISKAILRKPKKGFFARLLTQSPNRQRIKSWEADLEQISLHLTTQIQLRTAKLSQDASVESKKAVTQGIPTTEERIQQANQEALDLIKSQILKQTRKKLHKSSFGHFPPAASPIFYGRSHEVDWLVESLVKAPGYHAVLGPGGIGKTSVALNMLHDPRIVEVYGNHRYFLACECTSDAGGIIAGLADIFSLNEGAFLKQFKGLCEEVIGSNILFLLDNFETPWERKEARQKVEDFLTDLSSIPNLSIVITLRGAERPGGIRWSRPFLPVLGPLDFSAACQTFVAIAEVGYDDPDLVSLMEAVEFIPLAITLLAAQAAYTSCAFLLDQWQTQKTSMITRGWDSRLSSLDVSISLSLRSSRFSSNPQALPLLQILSLLPDGATVEELQQMTSDEAGIHQSVSTLLQVALASTTRHDRVHVLAPIREYIQSKHPISLALLQPVFSYHAELSRYAEASQWTNEAKNVDDILNPCISNIHYVLRMCLRVETLYEQALNASVNVASFRPESQSGSIGHLLEESVLVAREGGKLAPLSACLEKIGVRMWHSAYDRPLALGFLEEAVNVSRSLPTSQHPDQLVSSLTGLAWYMAVTWRNEEGIKFSQESVNSITTSTSPHLIAKAYIRLGFCQSRAKKYTEALNSLELASTYFNSSSSPLLKRLLSRAYVGMYINRDMYKKAIESVEMGFCLPPEVDSDIWRGRSLYERGAIWFYMSRFKNARRDLREAIPCLAISGSRAEVASAYCFLGLTYIASGNFEDAELSIHAANQFHHTDVSDAKLALAVLELYRNNLDQSLVYLIASLKELALSGFVWTSPAHSQRLAIRCQVQIQQRSPEALSSCVIAAVDAHKRQDRTSIAATILSLGDAYLFIQKDVLVSGACYHAFLDMVRYLGNWRSMANALLRLAVVDYLQRNASLAVRRLKQAMKFYEETDGKSYVEFCQRILQAIEVGVSLENIPLFPPLSPFGF